MLTSQQEDWYGKARALVDVETLAEAVSMLVDIPSATGEEGPLARAVVKRLHARGITAVEQVLDPLQSNVHATIAGTRQRSSLMLYAPVDTVTSNDAAEDCPWAAPELLPEMRALAVRSGDRVSGLGASNPKGHAACALAAFEAVARAGLPLAGTLYLGLGAGGMPTNARPGMRPDSGHGAGCAHMMRVGPRPDAAIIAKPGYAVAWEEVGLAWYEVVVGGRHGYAGSRHLVPYSNAIVNAARVVEGLEAWFGQWTDQTRSGLVAPQGVVSFIEGGWERMAAFTPAICRLRLDLRLSPRTSIADADAAIDAQLKRLSAVLGVELTWRRIVGIPGTTTAPDAPIVRTAIAAWEELEGGSHTPITNTSGATDANILRAFGVPTARIGMPKVQGPDIDFQRGMNTVSLEDMMRLTRHLLLVAVATCCP